MKKLIIINSFLIILLSSVYAINDNKINMSFFKKDINNNQIQLASSKNKYDIENKASLPRTSKKEEVEDYGILYSQLISMIKNYYVDDVDDKKLFESTLSSMLSSLDPHSAFLNEKDYKDISRNIKGEFSGLGIEVTMENSLIRIVSPIDNTPAFKAGIKAGDFISFIDDKPVSDMTLMEAIGIMRGKDEKDRGIVKLTILRKGEREPLEFKIKRDLIKQSSVRGKAEGEIAYIRISSFTEKTYPELITEFNKVENEIGKSKLKGLILDLRNNPGGILDTSVFISDSFLPKDKKIVTIKGKDGILLKEYKSQNDEDLIPNLPMVVLINEGSASASEIVAGALQDHKRAIILGTQSFGKGSVQNVMELKGIGGIKITTAKYYTPNDISIQAKGIVPDIEVKLAKIEEIDLSQYIGKESELKGHLENKDEDVVEKQKRKQIKSKDENSYNQDYQLARAIDLLLGISFYKENK